MNKIVETPFSSAETEPKKNVGTLCSYGYTMPLKHSHPANGWKNF